MVKLIDVDCLKVRMIFVEDLRIRVTLEDGSSLEFQYPTEEELSCDFKAWGAAQAVRGLPAHR